MANAREQATIEASCMWLACSERMEKEKRNSRDKYEVAWVLCTKGVCRKIFRIQNSHAC